MYLVSSEDEYFGNVYDIIVSFRDVLFLGETGVRMVVSAVLQTKRCPPVTVGTGTGENKA